MNFIYKFNKGKKFSCYFRIIQKTGEKQKKKIGGWERREIEDKGKGKTGSPRALQMQRGFKVCKFKNVS